LQSAIRNLHSPRPVTIVDTGYRKPLDLQVVMPVDDFRELPGKSIWPAVIPQVVGDIMRHRSTLIFCNNRRLAERTADRLNAQISAERAEEVEPGSTAVLAPGGVMRDRGMFAIGAEGPIRAHHGSMSKEARREMEEELKAGRLPALVGTSSLELGIDIGAVDLVVQLQSPKSVSQGLQRVGRSGHLVGQTSRGRVYATFREDLVEAAAVARGMLDGDVEQTLTPRNPLDVLAQQIAAMVSVEAWDAAALFDLVRGAYAYETLSRPVFDSVLDMLSGRYQELGGPGHASLRARLAWDRVNDRLAALPGTRLLALGNPGTIADTGAFDVYLADGKTKVGTLDEEFIHESRPGDVFLLGSSTWRMREIGADRIVVEEAAGALPRMPFWRGDYPWRQFQLGVRIGRLRREVAERLVVGDVSLTRPSTPVGEQLPTAAQGAPLIPALSVERTLAAGGVRDTAMAQDILAWLQRDYALDARAATGLRDYVKSQVDVLGAISSDRTIVVESFLDAVGDPRLVIHSPFGGRVNGAWALALDSALRERYGMGVEIQADDDGILMRLPLSGQQTGGPPPVDLIQGMSFDEARTRILNELPSSALFGARFRMNAARALLLPKARGQKRTPFWLQRLRAKDLLATVSKQPDFPLVTETYRDCLRDILDLPHLQEVLDGIRDGHIVVRPVETLVPSPLAAGMLFNFVNVYMYEWDAPKAERALQMFAARVRADGRPSLLLDDLLDGARGGALPKPEAVAEAVRRASHAGPEHAARSADELAVILAELGDLTQAEALARCAGDGAAWLTELAAQGRIVALPIAAGPTTEECWVPAELVEEYQDFQSPNILRRFLRHAGPVTRADILARYPFPPDWLDDALARLLAEREIVVSPPPDHYLDRHLFEQIQRRTLALLRREVQAVPVVTYAAFLLDWQGLRAGRTAGASASSGSLTGVLEQLRGVALPGVAWERDILPARLPRFQPDDLAALCESGAWVWAASGQDPRRADVRFFPRGEDWLFLPPPDEQPVSELAGRVLAFLKEEGASFLSDLQGGLGLKPAELRPAVIELTLAGLITNDALDGLHALLAYRGEPTGEHPPLSALEAELAARLGPRRPAGLTSAARYRAAKRRAAQLARDLDDAGGAEIWRGRWAPLHRAGVLGPPRADDERSAALARILLARYGIVTREVAEREGPPWAWESLYPILQRMELRGEARRGYFVAGLSGLQYALPDAVERLRAVAGAIANAEGGMQDADAPTVLCAVDPALLYSGALPGFTRPLARIPSTHIVLWRGQPILIAEENGERLAMAAGLAGDLAQRALAAYLARPNAPRRLAVTQWDDAPILGSAGQPILQQLGFTRTPAGMERWGDGL
jgi:ATP-dependent Lhr-like helicase